MFWHIGRILPLVGAGAILLLLGYNVGMAHRHVQLTSYIEALERVVGVTEASCTRVQFIGGDDWKDWANNWGQYDIAAHCEELGLLRASKQAIGTATR